MSLRKYTKADYERVKALRDQGMTYNAIGEQLGMSWQIARWILTQYHRLPEVLPSHFKKPGETSVRKKTPTNQEHVFRHDRYYIY